jgi:AcrR family transcriptional regulator
VGNREKLIEGAKTCIVERGYGRTTARDIADAAGVSLAAIGYHFGSKEALMTEALIDAVGAGMGDALEDAMRAHPIGTPPLAAFVATWRELLTGFEEHRRALVASMENLGQIDRVEEVRRFLMDAQATAITEIAELFGELTPGADDASCRAVARLYFALLNGLVIQWLIDPDQTPTAEDLGRAMRTLVSGP